jgi:hypothetical protein
MPEKKKAETEAEDVKVEKSEAETVDEGTVSEEELIKALDYLDEIAKGDESEDSDKAKDAKKSDKAEAKEDEAELEMEGKEEVKKAESETKESEDEGEEGEEGEEDEEKSFAENAYEESETIRKAIEVSDFLSEFVEAISDHLDVLGGTFKDEFQKSLATQQKLAKNVSESMRGLQDLIKSQGEEVEALTKRITELEKEPAPDQVRKSKLTILEKSNADQEQIRTNRPLQGMEKSMVANQLAQLAISATGGVTEMDVARFEHTGVIPPHAKQLIAQ